MSNPSIELSPLHHKSGRQISVDDPSFHGNNTEKKDHKIDIESNDTSAVASILENEEHIATYVISLDHDVNSSPYTFRAFFVGLVLSGFAGTLAEIYNFKPQFIHVSTLFLALAGYVIGIFMAAVIPRRESGFLSYLNPGPFCKKENSFILIMSSAAARASLATNVLAVQRLYYNISPNPASAIFLLLSSQLLGYGIGGLMRPILVYPTKMLYPDVLPLVTMLETFHKKGRDNAKKLKLFYILFTVFFVWEMFPQWIFPLLTGLSVFCLANSSSPHFTRIFGGSNANEGLGFLSICFDWQYISGGVNPMAIPLQAQVSKFIGYILCIVVFSAVYYGNIWKARNFPFLSQQLFYENGTVYKQSRILNSQYEVDPILLAKQGLPYFATTWVVGLLAWNLGMAATFTHLLLWNRDDLRSAWSWMTPAGVKEAWADIHWRFWQDNGTHKPAYANESDLDPHYREMLKYPDAPNSWYFLTLVLATVIAIIVIYKTNSTLPWWAFLVSIICATLAILFLGALHAITGFSFIIGQFMQMIGALLLPGRSVANMYFKVFSYNSVLQASVLLSDLKIAQYTKLPPRAAFTAQILGTVFGALLNYVIMNSIVDNKRDLLLSTHGTNVWSGQAIQKTNSQAIAWGGLSRYLFAAGGRYQWVAWAFAVGLVVPIPFWIIHRFWPKLRADYLYTPVICYYIGWLSQGINSQILTYFAVAWFSQWYFRKRFPKAFLKYNYIAAAALDGGAQVMVFLLSFVVQGASGKVHLFPQWWGANQKGNYDRCISLK